ncbi:MAG TPA: HAMP domain-containing sensor histidine kinase [Pararhizobium sp.]|nr:HAMP domain-containing sensor histidine kinase [Pararhizobium sp.]
MKRNTRSLTARVLLITSAWIAIALVVIALVISQLYRQGTERGFTDLLRAQLYNVINSVSIGKDGKLDGRPELGDLRFVQPETGWYWIVEPLGDFKAPPISSISLGKGSVPVPSTKEHPFDNHYERFYREHDSFGNEVEVAETEVLLDNNGNAARFRVVGNLASIEDQIDAFERQVLIAFVIFGLCSLAVNAAAILFGLRPLDVVRRRLEDIRAGRSEALTGTFPREIAPLVGEVNALIESNRRIVERARTQVGNLAHSLKTPIAVQLNEARRLPSGSGHLISTQAMTMQTQVQSYLDRARIAAQSATVLARTDAKPVVERLIRVMRRLYPDIAFAVEIEPRIAPLAMEQQDVEEVIGNLLDNAAKFSQRQVRLSISSAGRDGGAVGRAWQAVVIDDDGKGLEEAEIAEAMKRGRRLDETKPGTGLGLSIVSEIVGEYQGKLKLDRGEMGGLRATLALPATGDPSA